MISGLLVREAGLEPARPEWTLEPESSESANSTTRAFPERSVIIARRPAVVKNFLSLFFYFLDDNFGRILYNSLSVSLYLLNEIEKMIAR